MRRVVLITLLCACGAPTPEIAQTEPVVPSPGLPADLVLGDANNNLDVTWHDGRIYLAFRTAPTHFASPEVEMVVLSSPDQSIWEYEGRVSLGTDVREPQLVSWDGALWLYFAVLGTNPLDFEPQGTRRVRIAPDGWGEPEPVFDGDFLPWRIDPRDGRLEVFGYTGGANVYEPGGAPIEVRWLASNDGTTWVPAHGGDGVVLRGGGSETSGVLRKDGSLVAVVRNEAGDETGFGSKVCTARADDLATWTCAHDPRKYDSPLVFQVRGEVFLAARRHLANDGSYDLGETELELDQRYLRNQAAYWNAPKRCSLWRVDPEALAVTWLVDLPSRGDTCFPEIIEVDGDLWLYNYTSPVDGPDLPWIQGQTNPTVILRHLLDF